MQNIEFSFVTQKLGKGYLLTARQYGVVVWAPEVASGIKELETQVDAIATQLREAGVDLKEVQLESSQPAAIAPIWFRLLPFLVTTVTVAILSAAFLFPMANAVSRTFGPDSLLGLALNHPAQFLNWWAAQSDQMPFETVDSMKQSIRKISTKIKPVIAEVRSELSAKDNSNPSALFGPNQPAKR